MSAFEGEFAVFSSFSFNIITFRFLAKNFDPAKQLRTLPEFVERAHNRPTIEMMEKSSNLTTENVEVC